MVDEDFFDEEELLTEVEKDNGNLLRIKLAEWEGQKVVDIREYFYNQAKKDYYPTKKGVMLQAEELDNFSWILDSIKEFIET